MKKYLTALLILMTLGTCNPNNNEKAHYIYDSQNVLTKIEGNTMTIYHKSLPVYNSLGNIISYRGYDLIHFMDDDDGYSGDISFRKPASFLQSIDYYDSNWLLDEDNLNEFWPTYLTEFGNREDTVKIFLVHPIPGTDSIQLEQVHRFYKPNSEGGSRPDE